MSLSKTQALVEEINSYSNLINRLNDFHHESCQIQMECENIGIDVGYIRVLSGLLLDTVTPKIDARKEAKYQKLAKAKRSEKLSSCGKAPKSNRQRFSDILEKGRFIRSSRVARMSGGGKNRYEDNTDREISYAINAVKVAINRLDKLLK